MEFVSLASLRSQVVGRRRPAEITPFAIGLLTRIMMINATMECLLKKGVDVFLGFVKGIRGFGDLLE